MNLPFSFCSVVVFPAELLDLHLKIETIMTGKYFLHTRRVLLLASVYIPTRDGIHQYQCNNPFVVYQYSVSFPVVFNFSKHFFYKLCCVGFFMALRHFSGHFGRGQLTYPHCS